MLHRLESAKMMSDHPSRDTAQSVYLSGKTKLAQQNNRRLAFCGVYIYFCRILPAANSRFTLHRRQCRYGLADELPTQTDETIRILVLGSQE